MKRAEPRLQRKLREALANPQRSNEPNVLHRLLASVARRTPLAIITTNYDDLIERALGDVPYDLFVVAVDRTSGGSAAGTVLFLLPVAIFTFLLRKHLLRGMSFGAIRK